MKMRIKIFQQKYLYLLALLLMTSHVYSQYGRVRFSFKSELEKRLFPQIDTTSTKEIVLFYEMPSFDNPEQSLRIVEIGNQSFIEARILERNLWIELNRIKPNDSLSVETCYFAASISNSFKNKMLATYSKVIVFHKNTIRPKKIIRKSFRYHNGKVIGEDEVEGPDIFDGTSYEFRINDSGIMSNTKIRCPLGSNDFRYIVSMTNLQIINDLKNNSFNESKYDIYK